MMERLVALLRRMEDSQQEKARSSGLPVGHLQGRVHIIKRKDTNTHQRY